MAEKIHIQGHVFDGLNSDVKCEQCGLLRSDIKETTCVKSPERLKRDQKLYSAIARSQH